jgi:hypothetical protein
MNNNQNKTLNQKDKKWESLGGLKHGLEDLNKKAPNNFEIKR